MLCGMCGTALAGAPPAGASSSPSRPSSSPAWGMGPRPAHVKKGLVAIQSKKGSIARVT